MFASMRNVSGREEGLTFQLVQLAIASHVTTSAAVLIITPNLVIAQISRQASSMEKGIPHFGLKYNHHMLSHTSHSTSGATMCILQYFLRLYFISE